MAHPASKMHRPMIDISIAKYGFTLDQVILFCGNDSLYEVITAMEEMHDLPEDTLIDAYDNMDNYFFHIADAHFNITLKIYDFAPKGRTLNGVL